MASFLRRLPRSRKARLGLGAAALGAVLAALVALFPGCKAPYVRRQAVGALRVLWNREAIDEKLFARLPEREGDQLRFAAGVREYAARELGLDASDAYTTYYENGGKPITTIVAAAHPLALVPYRWRFPIAGRVPYLGHFDPAEARAERDRLRAEGWDAVALPVDAFSSLGWFSDPVLSTMLDRSKGDLADLLIHELTHRTLYFPGETELNESLATVIAQGGAERLLLERFGETSSEVAEYRRKLAQDDLRDGILKRLERDLDALYRSRVPDAAKLSRKSELFSTAARSLDRSGIRHRLAASNALLILDRQYSGLVPLLREAQKALGGHPRDLLRALRAHQDADDPVAALAAEITSLSAAPPARAAPGE